MLSKNYYAADATGRLNTSRNLFLESFATRHKSASNFQFLPPCNQKYSISANSQHIVVIPSMCCIIGLIFDRKHWMDFPKSFIYHQICPCFKHPAWATRIQIKASSIMPNSNSLLTQHNTKKEWGYLLPMKILWIWEENKSSIGIFQSTQNQ